MFPVYVRNSIANEVAVILFLILFHFDWFILCSLQDRALVQFPRDLNPIVGNELYIK